MVFDQVCCEKESVSLTSVKTLKNNKIVKSVQLNDLPSACKLHFVMSLTKCDINSFSKKVDPFTQIQCR